MTIEVDPAESTARRHLPGLVVAGVASAAAGAIHLSVAGSHAEHPTLARLFVVCGVAQLCAGVWALLRPNRAAAASLALVSSLAVGAWLVTRLTAVSWIAGLGERESPGFADTACALLGLVAAGAATTALVVGPQPAARPPRLALPGLVAAALAVPAMLTGGTDVHRHAEHTATGAAAAPVPEEHDHAAEGDPTVTTSVPDDGTNHGHAVGEEVASVGTRPWPRPWDPAQPIDLSHVAGVTPEQEARAAALVERSLAQLPHWSDTATAVAEGYRSIGDAATGSEHYIKYSLIEDGVILDPAAPESLVYDVDGDRRTLAGAMFIAPAQPTDSPDLLDWAGPLMEWHNHGDLCWDASSGTPRVVGVVGEDGTCAVGVHTGGENPMVHVWITPHPCGVFAALEGIGAGQAAVSDEERADMCHDHHATPGGTADVADDAVAAVAPVPYDPTKPIDLGGVPGVTPEQQAAAENLVAVNVVRLPQWADVATGRPLGSGRSATRRRGSSTSSTGSGSTTTWCSTRTSPRASSTSHSRTARSGWSARCTCCRPRSRSRMPRTSGVRSCSGTSTTTCASRPIPSLRRCAVSSARTGAARPDCARSSRRR